MWQQFAWHLLATLLLTQLVCALPAPTDSSSASEDPCIATTTIEPAPTTPTAELDSENYIAEEWSPRNKLLFFTLEEFTALSNFTVEQGTRVFRGVLQDATLEKEPSALLQAHLANITDYVTQAERIRQLPEDEKVAPLYDLVVQFSEIVERYNASAPQPPSTEVLYLEASLKKNGLDQLQVDFLEKFLTFAQKFNAQIEGYLNGLNERERAQEAKMIDWYQRFGKETNGEKKVEVFAKFFDLYV